MERYFKYLSPGGAKPTLTNRTLRWSRPSMFNDLFDMAVPFAATCNSEPVLERAVELMWERVIHPNPLSPQNKMGAVLDAARVFFREMGKDQFYAAMRPGVAESLAKYPKTMEAFGLEVIAHLSRVKALCFSRVHDDNAMWGLYADNHRGLVLEFANAEGVDSAYSLAEPVAYRDQPPHLLDDEMLAQFLAGNFALEPKLADPLMFLKSTHWSYEQELRIVTGEGRKPGDDFEDVPFHPKELVAVYFGARSAALRAELEPVVIAKYPHAQRWQASKGQGFRIDFTRVDTASA